MFGNYFYFQLFRKYISAFTGMFNRIYILKIDSNGNELDRVLVPIIYGAKEKYVTRLEQDPDLNSPTAITLPIISIGLTSMQYDATRKQNTMLRTARANNSVLRADSQYMSVPYDLLFDLDIYARNQMDADQIVEQILPFFTPDYTITVQPVGQLQNLVKDIPIVLNSVSNNTTYEGNFDSIRYVNWSMSFTMKVHFFGPIAPTNIIRTVITNIFNDPSETEGYIYKLTVQSGNGTFGIGDTVFQGNSFSTASAYGTVEAWDSSTLRLQLGGVQGRFTVNNTIHAVSTNAVYQIASFDTTPLKLSKIVITPDPPNALPNSDYGYVTSITEFPNA